MKKTKLKHEVDSLIKNISPYTYIWVSKKFKENLNDINIKDLKIEDIPNPKKIEKLEETLEDIVENAEKFRNNFIKEKLLENPDDDYAIVSEDRIEKYKIVKEFIQEKGLKIYGGVAVNSYLPKEEKLYDKNDIPDYDIYSYDPWNHAIELADIFYKQGYKYCEAKAGLHKGTFKVFVDLWSVADFTYIPKKQFDLIKTKKVNNLNVVEPLKLLENMYKEFSEPLYAPDRWEKVFIREKLLKKYAFPLGKKINCENVFINAEKDNNYFVNDLIEECFLFLKKKDVLFTGALAYNKYMKLGESSRFVRVSCIDFLGINAKNDIIELYEYLLGKEDSLSLNILTLYNPARELNDYCYQLRINLGNGEYKIIANGVYLNSCTPYKTFGKLHYASIDYIKYDLYYDVVYNVENSEEEKKCMIQNLEIVQTEYYKKNKKTEFEVSPFQRLLSKCKGQYVNPRKKAILDRFLEKEERKSKIEKTYVDGYKIIKIPEKEISEICAGKMKEDCGYPCEYFNGKCRDQRSSYMAGKESGSLLE
jgi:hypothetical protein